MLEAKNGFSIHCITITAMLFLCQIYLNFASIHVVVHVGTMYTVYEEIFMAKIFCVKVLLCLIFIRPATHKNLSPTKILHHKQLTPQTWRHGRRAQEEGCACVDTTLPGHMGNSRCTTLLCLRELRNSHKRYVLAAKKKDTVITH